MVNRPSSRPVVFLPSLLFVLVRFLITSGVNTVSASELRTMSVANKLIVVFMCLVSVSTIGQSAPRDEKCLNCVEEPARSSFLTAHWTMPLSKLGERRYYLGTFFKANWYKAAKFCNYHGMQLASIESQIENDQLEKHIKEFGFGNEHFWIAGTDQGEEGSFFWMSTGRPITFTNWNAGEPNNFRYENGEEEHCLELWNRDGKGMKWNDSPCSFETYFVCEAPL